MRQDFLSSFILSQTFLTLFLLKNNFTRYECLGMHAAFQPCFLQWNYFLPPAPDRLVLHYSYLFLKPASFSLADSTKIWLSDTKCLRLTYMPCIFRLGVAVPHSSPAVAAAERRVCLHGCVRPGEKEEAAGCWYWDLAEPALGPSELLLFRLVFLYPLVSGHERALLPEAIQHKPLALLSLQWLGGEYITEKLLFPTPSVKQEH